MFSYVLSFLSTQALSLTFSVGLALLAIGFAMIYTPLAWIVPGAALIALPVLGLVRRKAEE